jgi:predicted methyltransferase
MSKNNTKYNLIVENGKEITKMPLSYSAVSSIAADLQDHKDNTKYFSVLSNHPSVDVRSNIAIKEKLDKETVLRLANDTSVTVLRSLSSNSAFKKIATIDMLEKMIKLDEEIAKNVGYHIAGYAECDIDKIVDLLFKTESPEVLFNLACNSDLPKKYIKSLLDNSDSKVVLEAKSRLENI